MLKEEAKRYVLQEWSALPAQERTTSDQAVVFAMKMTNKVEFRCAGDRYQVIKGWLLNRLDRS